MATTIRFAGIEQRGDFSKETTLGMISAIISYYSGYTISLDPIPASIDSPHFDREVFQSDLHLEYLIIGLDNSSMDLEDIKTAQDIQTFLGLAFEGASDLDEYQHRRYLLTTYSRSNKSFDLYHCDSLDFVRGFETAESWFGVKSQIEVFDTATLNLVSY